MSRSYSLIIVHCAPHTEIQNRRKDHKGIKMLLLLNGPLEREVQEPPGRTGS